MKVVTRNLWHSSDINGIVLILSHEHWHKLPYKLLGQCTHTHMGIWTHTQYAQIGVTLLSEMNPQHCSSLNIQSNIMIFGRPLLQHFQVILVQGISFYDIIYFYITVFKVMTKYIVSLWCSNFIRRFLYEKYLTDLSGYRKNKNTVKMKQGMVQHYSMHVWS